MSSTAVSTVSLTLQPGKTIIEHDYIQEPPHKNHFQIAAQETKQPEKEVSNGITLQSHQTINEKIKEENEAHSKDDEPGSDTAGVDNLKFVEKDSEKEKGEGRREQGQIPDSVATSEGHEDFKQDRLLLDGPGQRYRLEKGGNIPELQTDREVLIQVSPVSLSTKWVSKLISKVVTIGLNPVDWKGP